MVSTCTSYEALGTLWDMTIDSSRIVAPSPLQKSQRRRPAHAVATAPSGIIFAPRPGVRPRRCDTIDLGHGGPMTCAVACTSEVRSWCSAGWRRHRESGVCAPVRRHHAVDRSFEPVSRSRFPGVGVSPYISTLVQPALAPRELKTELIMAQLETGRSGLQPIAPSRIVPLTFCRFRAIGEPRDK